MMNEIFVDRRTLIADMLLLVGSTAVPSSAIAAISALPTQAGAKPRFLRAADMTLLRELAEAMIPRTDTPGAIEAGVPEFIDGLMVDWAGAGAREQLRRVLQDLRLLAASRGKTREARLTAIAELDRRSFAASGEDAGAEAYRWLKRLVFLGYRSSEAAFTSYVPNPGKYRGNLTRAEYDALTAEHLVGRG
jgi:hypothetical protein